MSGGPGVACASTGAIVLAVGVWVVMPDVAMVSSGNTLHVTVDGPPGRSKVREGLPIEIDAVLGGTGSSGGMVSGGSSPPETDVGDGGMSTARPDGGTDAGMGTSKVYGPAGMPVSVPLSGVV